MESREGLTLEKNNRMTTLRQRDRRRRSSRTATGDGEIKVISRFSRCHEVRLAQANISNQTPLAKIAEISARRPLHEIDSQLKQPNFPGFVHPLTHST